MSSIDVRQLQKLYDEYSSVEYQQLLLGIVEELHGVLRSLPIKYQIKHRVKDFRGYFKKLTARQQGETAPISDILGVRIICPFLEDLSLVETALLERFPIPEVHRKGEARSFQEFGYDSIHLLLDLEERPMAHPLPEVEHLCEIQLRTILQDAWAEVEHELIYKSDWSIPTDQIRRKLAALNANLTLSDIIFQELREFQREVFRKQERRRDIQKSRSGLLSPAVLHPKLHDETRDLDDGDDLEKLILKALTAHSEEEFSRAIRLYSRALTLPGPDAIRSILFNHRGMAYFALNENNAARSDFKTALSQDADNYRAWYNLGLAQKALGDHQWALDSFANSLEKNPSFLEAAIQKIYVLMDLGENEKAQVEFAELQKSHPDVPEVCLLQKEIDEER